MTPSELKRHRKALGLTQTEMAKTLGMTQVHYNRLERDKSPITSTVARLVRLLAEKASA